MISQDLILLLKSVMLFFRNKIDHLEGVLSSLDISPCTEKHE